MIEAHYESKRQLKNCVGQKLKYTEIPSQGTGTIYTDNGWFGVNGPEGGKNWSARVTMKDGLIYKVE